MEKHVYKAIAEVQAELSKIGIGKDQKNQQQGYKFRGIDDVYNALAPLLSKHGLCVLPKVINRECIERTNKSGSALFYVTVQVEYSFVSANDGSSHLVVTYGEAMDSGDKATNKAMSAAYKYACLQTFCIPTEGDNDADAVTHAVEPIDPEIEQELRSSAMLGMSALKKTWAGLDKKTREALHSKLMDFKAVAAKADGIPPAVA